MSALLRVIFLSYERGLTQPASDVFARVEALAEEGLALSAIVLPATSTAISERGGLRTIGLTGPAPIRLCRVLWRTIREVRGAQKKGERVVLSAQDPFIAGSLVFMVSRLLNVPYEIQEHGDYFSGAWVAEAPLSHRLWAFIGRGILRRADTVRVVSERIRERVARMGVTANRIAVVPVAQQLSELLDRPVRPWPATPTIVIPCRFVKQKGLDILLNALATCATQGIPFRVRLIGEGPEGPRVAALADRLKIRDRISFEQWSDPKELWADADLFVLSSNYEGWGRTITEAMAAGVPVITTDVGCVGSFFRPQVDGLAVPPGDVVALATAIQKQYADAESRQAMVVAARARIAELPEPAALRTTQRQAWKGAAVRPASSRRIWMITAGLIVIAALIRAVSFFWFGDSLADNREWGFFNLVRSWFEGNGYSFATEPGYPSAYRSPGFLFFLTVVYGLFGFANFTAQALIQNILAVIAVYVAYRLGWRVSGDRRVGWLVGLFVALHPYAFYHYTQYYHTVLSSLFLGSLLLCLLALERTQKFRWAMWTGVFTAALAYVQGTILIAMPFLAAWLLWRWRHQFRRAIIAIAIIALVSAGLIAPWTIRNWNAFHAFVPLTTDLGFAFYKANTENYERLLIAGYPHEALREEIHPTDSTLVRYRYLPEVEAMLKQTGGITDAAYWTQWHPVETSPRAIQVGSPLTEPAYNAHWMGLAKQWITAHPSDFARLAVRKAVTFWQPGLHPSIKYGAAWSFGNEGIIATLARWSLVAYVTMLEIMAVAAIIIMARRKQWSLVAPLLIVMVVYTAMHMLFAPYTKYRIPLDQCLAVFAAIAGMALWDRVRRQKKK